MADVVALQEIGAVVAQVGFPVVAFYLMFTMAKDTIKENTKALIDIRLVLEKVCTKLEDNHNSP